MIAEHLGLPWDDFVGRVDIQVSDGASDDLSLVGKKKKGLNVIIVREAILSPMWVILIGLWSPLFVLKMP